MVKGIGNNRGKGVNMGIEQGSGEKNMVPFSSHPIDLSGTSSEDINYHNMASKLQHTAIEMFKMYRQISSYIL